MRSLNLTFACALVLAACATPAPAAGGPNALRGCWIERRGEQTVTQRWFPDRGGWRGDELTYFQAGEPDPVRWRLKHDPDGDWRMCMEDLAVASSPPCWRAVFGPGSARDPDDRWVEIAASPERLTITYVTPPDRAVTYNGARDGCD